VLLCRSLVQQDVHRIGLAGGGGQHQRGYAIGTGTVNVVGGRAFAQDKHHVFMAALRGEHEGGQAAGDVDRVAVAHAGLDHALDRSGIAIVDCGLKRRTWH
jgi:hypothetical protein